MVSEGSLLYNVPALITDSSFVICNHFTLSSFYYRVDQKKENYIGAICGLGVDRFSDQPAMPDHDMEVAFDTNITLEDIFKVSLATVYMCLDIVSEIGVFFKLTKLGIHVYCRSMESEWPLILS